MGRFLLVAALIVQFPRQLTETFAGALRCLPPAERSARVLQTLREERPAPPTASECVTPTRGLFELRALVGIERSQVQLKSR